MIRRSYASSRLVEASQTVARLSFAPESAGAHVAAVISPLPCCWQARRLVVFGSMAQLIKSTRVIVICVAAQHLQVLRDSIVDERALARRMVISIVAGIAEAKQRAMFPSPSFIMTHIDVGDLPHVVPKSWIEGSKEWFAQPARCASSMNPAAGIGDSESSAGGPRRLSETESEGGDTAHATALELAARHLASSPQRLDWVFTAAKAFCCTNLRLKPSVAHEIALHNVLGAEDAGGDCGKPAVRLRDGAGGKQFMWHGIEKGVGESQPPSYLQGAFHEQAFPSISRSMMSGSVGSFSTLPASVTSAPSLAPHAKYLDSGSFAPN